MILRDKSEVLDPRLGYIPEPDTRNFGYLMYAAPYTPKIKKRLWTCPQFDQGATPRCVAYAIGHELAATPVAVKGITDSFLYSLYCEAQKIDPWVGSECGNNPPKYGGTSLLAGIKTAQNLGFFKEYRWAYNVETLALGIAMNGPAVLGIRWYAGMTTPDSKGFISRTGALQGGHAILAIGVDYPNQFFTFRNSWGPDYGDNGNCYVPFKVMEELYKNQEAEAAFFIGRKYKNIV